MKEGDYEPDDEYECKCDKKGKTWEGAERKHKIVWEVRLEDEEEAGIDTYFTCKSQFDAEILSRLVRIEKLLRKRK